jgi:hypothetical protein
MFLKMVTLALVAIAFGTTSPAMAAKKAPVNASPIKTAVSFDQCLETCQAINRPKPGFLGNPANRGFCRRKCGGS